jgi:hypothetical protein
MIPLVANDTFFQIVICLLIFRIAITSYCVERAKTLNRKQLDWGVFSFFFPIVAFIWIKVLKPLPSKKVFIGESSLRPESNGSDMNNSDKLNNISIQKKSLLDLKEKKILTINEYEEKLAILKQAEMIIRKEDDETSERLKDEELNYYIEKQIEPEINDLKILLGGGLINQTEFDNKRHEIFSAERDFIIKIPTNKIKLTNLNTEWHRRAARDFFKKSNGKCLIFLNAKKNSIVSYSTEEFEAIKSKIDPKDYYYIQFPANFKPDQIK